MDANAKRQEIIRMYGTVNFKGRSLYDMPDKQIHAIYGQLVHSGKFEEYAGLKQSYISLFPNAHWEATRRANKMSVFELRKTIQQIMISKEEQEPEGYQYTLFDWMNQLFEGGEENGNSSKACSEEQSNQTE